MSGSISASTSPFLTTELKSTSTCVTRPLTCAPTLTSSIGCTVPVACTFSTTSPTAAVAVTYFAGGGGACAPRQARAPAMTRTNDPPTAPRRNQRRPPSSAPSAFFRSSVTAVDWVMGGGSASFLAEGAGRGHGGQCSLPTQARGHGFCPT